MNEPKVSRRDWFRICGVAAAGAATHNLSAAPASLQPQETVLKTYFGDLHNHNVIGYGQGSLRRTFEIARNHLDFLAFTPHGYWPDMGSYEGHIQDKWINGFAVTKERWPEVLATVREFHTPGKFVVIPGYERHSTYVGDYHILFPTVEAAEYRRIAKLRDFQKFAKDRGAIIVPHHPANRLGHRGANMALRDPEISPVLEMYSEWGNAEHDRGPYPYKRHSEGGRWTKNTMQWFLKQGYRFGVVASTDDHLGHPGAYREGLAAIKAPKLTREALFDALRNRRTYAVTGDRIELDFHLNGKMMGQEMPYARQRELDVSVSGWDQVDRVELLKNNRVIHRDFPLDRVPNRKSWDRPVLIRFEYGWGPWPALAIARLFDWDIRIKIEGGVLEEVYPCFCAGPLSENHRDRILEKTDRSVRVISFSELKQRVDDFSQKSVALKARGTPQTRINVSIEMPGRPTLTQTFAQLAESNEMLFTGDFPKESAMLHRPVFQENYKTSFTVHDEDDGTEVNWYYVRVVQANDQLAWSSPIWVEKQLRADAGAGENIDS
jgi:hypothetical protein